jgi:lactoylglutathione lyase
MKLNHLNLTVTDVPATRRFLETYFGLRPMAGEAASKSFDVLFDDAGLVLTLIKGRDVKYPSTFHIGFLQPTERHVDELNERLRADGYPVKPAGRAHGAWTFYFRAPGGFVVEVLC